MKSVSPIFILISLMLTNPSITAQTDLPGDLTRADQWLLEGDYEKAFPVYLKAAEEQDNTLAQFTVGLFYQMGWGRPADPAAACGWFARAAEGGVPVAQHYLADCLKTGLRGPADPARAAVWYEKAARQGYLISWCSLAELYMTGTGVEKDPLQAIALCKQAAQNASPVAQARLGRFYLEGDESIRDPEQAYYWLDMAAQRKVPEAWYFLGVICRDGLGRPADPNAAKVWFEKAASSQYGPAYLAVGQLYWQSPADPLTGKISARDLAKAYLWLSAAGRTAKDPHDQEQVQALLADIDRIMPSTWKPELDAKVDAHFAPQPGPAQAGDAP